MCTRLCPARGGAKEGDGERRRLSEPVAITGEGERDRDGDAAMLPLVYLAWWAWSLPWLVLWSSLSESGVGVGSLRLK